MTSLVFSLSTRTIHCLCLCLSKVMSIPHLHFHSSSCYLPFFSARFRWNGFAHSLRSEASITIRKSPLVRRRWMLLVWRSRLRAIRASTSCVCSCSVITTHISQTVSQSVSQSGFFREGQLLIYRLLSLSEILRVECRLRRNSDLIVLRVST